MATFSWKTPLSDNWNTPSDWDAGSVPNSATADAFITVPGAYSVQITGGQNFTVDSLDLNDPDATLAVQGTLALGGVTNTLTLNAGTLQLSGTIGAGTIVANGGTLLAQGGTLSGVTWRGVLAPAGDLFPSLFVTGGLTLQTAVGGQPGSIDLSGFTDGMLSVLDSETLDNATLNFGAGTSNALANGHPGNDSGHTLTLGGGFTINNVSGNGNNLGGAPVFGVNDAGDTLNNAGLINVSAGILTVGYGTFNNTGSVNVAGGALAIQSSALTNTGGITVSNAGTVAISGTLNNTEQTLSIELGTGTGFLAVHGTILGGTVLNNGLGLLAQGGTLSGVTWRGVLAPTGALFPSLFVTGGLTLQTAAGGQPGSIDLSGFTNGMLSVLDSETLDNATLNFGAGTSDALASGQPGADSGHTLTLGGGFTINVSSNGNNLGGAPAFGVTDAGDTLNNAGLINVSAGNLTVGYGTFNNTGSVNLAGGVLNTPGITTFVNDGGISVTNGDRFFIQAATFTNGGSLSVGNGSTLVIAPVTFTNLSGNTLTGGSFEADAGGTLQLPDQVSFLVDAANITLSGGKSVIESLNTGSAAQVQIDTLLGTIAAGGALHLLAGRGFTTAADFTDNGALELGASTFGAASLTIGATGTVYGNGTIVAAIANSGTVRAAGGLLDLDGGATGSGGLFIDVGATLELGAASTGAVNFNPSALSGGTLAGGTLKVDTASSYTGTINGFAPADTIDLANLIVTSASITASDTLVANISGGGTQTYAVTGNFATDILKVTGDGGTGTDLILYHLAQASSATPNPIDFGNVHTGSVQQQAITVGNTPPADGFTENLDASIGGATGAVTANGSFSLLAAGGSNNSSLVVGLVTGTDGARNGAATITLQSDGAGVDGNGLTTINPQTIAATGTVYNFATASAASRSPVAFGNRHVGDTLSQAVTISNTGTADGFSEALDAGIGGTTGSASASGSFGGLAAGATNNSSLIVGLGSAKDGTQSGTAKITLTSDGAGIDSLGTTALTTQTITATGTLYNLATASAAAPNPVNFGIVHVGDTVSQTLSISNLAAADGFSENLNGGIGNPTGAVVAHGSFSGLTASATDTTDLSVGVDTRSAAVISGSATITLQSDGTGIDALGAMALGPQTVTVNATVNNFAVATIEELSGGGTFGQNGTAYTINLGTIALGASVAPINLGILNAVSGPSDFLSGSFVTSGSAAFSLTGFGPFSGLAAGQDDIAPTIALSTTIGGLFTETVTLTPTGSNTGGFSHVLPTETLTVTADVACFVSGTLIQTDRGDVPVEQLRAGDLVRSLKGELRTIRWIGHRHIDLARHPEPPLAQPIRIRSNAFADGVPRRDLLVSPDHAIYADGLLIPARLLRNGTTIVRDERRGDVTYFHLELDQHDIVLAEGLPAESYLDTGNRGMFENSDAALVLYPDLTSDEGQARRETLSCAPFAADALKVEPVWRRLAERAGQLEPVLSEQATTDDPALRVHADGRILAPIEVTNGRYVFVLPSNTGAVRLISRSAAPCEARPWVEDRRRLGVAVRRLTVRRGCDDFPVSLDHPALTEGWWDVERDGAAMWRWTDGDAPLPVAALPVDGSAALLVVELGGTMAHSNPAAGAEPGRPVHAAAA